MVEWNLDIPTCKLAIGCRKPHSETRWTGREENAPESLHTLHKPLSHGRLSSGIPQLYKDLLSPPITLRLKWPIGHQLITLGNVDFTTTHSRPAAITSCIIHILKSDRQIKTGKSLQTIPRPTSLTPILYSEKGYLSWHKFRECMAREARNGRNARMKRIRIESDKEKN